MPELGGRELLREWEKLMGSVVGTATSVPREVWDAQQRLQRELVSRAIAPFDLVFDLLAQSAATMRNQAEALESAGKALQDAARLMQAQAEMFERTVKAMRQPTDLVKSAAVRDPARRSPRE